MGEVRNSVGFLKNQFIVYWNTTLHISKLTENLVSELH